MLGAAAAAATRSARKHWKLNHGGEAEILPLLKESRTHLTDWSSNESVVCVLVPV